MYIYIREFWQNSLFGHHIQAAMTYLWDVSHFRQCSAIPLLSGQHGLFLKTLPDKYMCYFHIYAHIYKVFLAKLSFLTSYSGRNGRFRRWVSLSQVQSLPRATVGNKAFFWKLHYINICVTFIYINLSVRYYFQNSLFWHQIQTVLAAFWDVHQFRKIHNFSHGTVEKRVFSWKLHQINLWATFTYMHVSIRKFWQNSLFWHQIHAALADFRHEYIFRQIQSIIPWSVCKGAFSLKIHQKNMGANFIYMYIYMRYFWKNSPLWIHIQAAMT